MQTMMHQAVQTLSPPSIPPSPPGARLFQARRHPFHALMDQLLAFNHDNRQRSIALTESRHVPLMEYLTKWCTIVCDVGRDTGKTTFIMERAGPNDLVIVASLSVKRKYSRSEQRFVVATIDEIIDGRRPIHAQAFKTVYVDDASQVFAQCPRELMYRRLAISPYQNFILLG